MKKQLLDLKGESELKIPGIEVKKANFEFDFKSKKLDVELNDQKDDISTYFISKEMADAVNAAIITGRPLLLKGEPGCGKTKLAKAVAAYFFRNNLSKYYFEWFVKSKSKAKEGAYTFDHVSRLRDATIANTNKAAAKKVQDPTKYISLGPMGNAFTTKAPKGFRPILLIDEIDKGDIDFPNDLLLELDEMRFGINELTGSDKFISADPANRPLVFITSNDERELPPAFLRRCLYYRIPSFDNALLEKIANSKMKKFADEFEREFSKEVENVALLEKEQIVEIVKLYKQKRENTASVKVASTSELLDWLKMILYQVNFDKKEFSEVITDLTLQEISLKLM